MNHLATTVWTKKACMASSFMFVPTLLPFAFLKGNSPLLRWLRNSIYTRPLWYRSWKDIGHSIWFKSVTLHSEAFSKPHFSLETMRLKVTTTQHRIVHQTIPLLVLFTCSAHFFAHLSVLREEKQAYSL